MNARLVTFSTVVLLLCGSATAEPRKRSSKTERPGQRQRRWDDDATLKRKPYDSYPVNVNYWLDLHQFDAPNDATYYEWGQRSRGSYNVISRPTMASPANNGDRTLAERQLRDGRYADALLTVERAINANPDQGYLYLIRSDVRLALGDYAAAAEDISLALDLLGRRVWQPLIEKLVRDNGASFYRTHLRRLEQFSSASPGVTQTQFLLGFHYLHLGEREKAERHLTRAIELDAYPELAAALLETPAGWLSGTRENVPVPVPTP